LVEKVEIRRALTRRSLAIGLVFTFAIFFYIWYGQYAASRLPSDERLGDPSYPKTQPFEYIVRRASDRDMRWRGMLEPWFAVMLLPAVICAALPKKWRLSPPELAFVTTMCAVSLTLELDFTSLWVYHRAMFIPEVGARRIKPFAPYVPRVWGPRPAIDLTKGFETWIDPADPMVDVLRAFRRGMVPPGPTPKTWWWGTGSVPWGPWLIPLLAWIGLSASLLYFFLFGAALLRRQYLDIEALPFPQASAAGSFINLSDSEAGRANLFRGTSLYLWIGVLATLLVEINAILTSIKPAWALANPIPVELDLTPNALFAGVPYFNWWPLLLGLALLFTRAVNFSAFLMCTIWLWVLPDVFVRSGVWPVTITPGDARLSNAGRLVQWLIRRGFTHPEWGGAMQGWGFLAFWFGTILGLAVWPIVVHRRAWASSIRAAIRGEAAGPEEVSSYRNIWLGWGASFGVCVAMLMLFGLHIQWALLWVLYMGTMFLGYTRLQAECGWVPNMGITALNHRIINTQIIMNHTPIGYDANQAFAFGPLCFVYGMRGNPAFDWEGWNGLSWRLENFRIGSLTRSRPRDIFVSQAIAIPIGTAFLLPFYLWWFYTVGIQRQNAAAVWNLGASAVVEHTLTDKIPGMIRWSYGYAGGQSLPPIPCYVTYSMYLVGFALIAVIFTLRARFGGLLTLISPAGIALPGLNFAFWFPCLIVFIVQTIVIRVGGTRLYEEKVRPIGVGMLIGYGILWIIVTAAYFIRGIPYIEWPQIRWPWSPA